MTFFSSPTVTGTQSRSESERLQPAACQPESEEAVGQMRLSHDRIAAAYRDMTEALIASTTYTATFSPLPATRPPTTSGSRPSSIPSKETLND
jgi:hypothetical protein